MSMSPPDRLILSLILLGTIAPASAQSLPEVRAAEIYFAASPPTIDGIVEAGEWDHATAAGGWNLLRGGS